MRSFTEAQRQAIERDLRRLVEGEVLFDEISRVLYASSACIYEIPPLGVVLPRHAEDVVAVMRYAHERDIPVIPRGAASGVAGQAIGWGLVLDFTKHMNRLLEVHPRENFVQVQPGLVLERLNEALRPYGKFFPPDPSSGRFCTLGGMIATNAAGIHSLKYGTTKDYVLGLDVVLANGERVWLADEGDPLFQRLTGTHPQVVSLVEGLRHLLQTHWERIEAQRPKVNKSSSGYNLWEALEGERVRLTRLLAGSEGTLALFVEARLAIRDAPRFRSVALLSFASLEALGEAVERALGFGPSGVEMIDRTLLEELRRLEHPAVGFLPSEVEAALIVEFDGDDEEEVRSLTRRLVERLLREEGLAVEGHFAFDPKEQERLLAVRKASVPILYRASGRRKPLSFVEDGTVAPEHLPAYLRGLRQILGKHGVHAAIIGHAGNGNLHVRPFLDLQDPEDLRKVEAIAEEVAALLKTLGGSLSGEHGDGLVRTPLLPKMFGDLYPLLGAIKRLFDPKGLLNPGKIVLHPEAPLRITEFLRYGAEYRRVPTGTPFDEPLWAEEIEKCHGCGTCRDYCPVFLATGDEAATARAKANLLRAVIRGDLPPSILLTEGFKAVMDLCVNCRLCLTECPTQVNIPDLCIQARGYYVAHRGQTLQNRILAEAQRTSRLGSLAAPWANAAHRFIPLRRLMEKSIGLDQRRCLPLFQRPAFLTYSSPDGWLARHRVLYFPGCFASFSDPQGEAWATVEVLERNGCFVLTPPGLRCCGVAKVTVGSLEEARDDAERNVRILLPWLEEGFLIVASAASCGLALKQDYPHLLGTSEARRVAENTWDVHEFLLMLKRRGELNTRFGPVPLCITYHAPCHLRAQGVGDAPLELLRQVPALEIREIRDSCCGIAGTFGMKHQNFDLAMRMGSPLFQEIRRAQVEKVLSGCGTCKIQIEQGTGVETWHPIRILRDAYRAGEPNPPSFALPEGKGLG